jgi:hypothetical protein
MIAKFVRSNCTKLNEKEKQCSDFFFTVVFDFLVFNVAATFSNISAVSWRSILVVEEAGVPGENHQPCNQ